MADAEEIRKKLREFITDTFLIGTDIETVEDSDSFMEQEIVDSTGVLELTAFIETEWGIIIEDDEMIPENLDSIDNLVKFITSKAA
jgi:acyl carrier protein